MKKRLKKKLYLDEFAVMGFEFSCKIKPGASLTTDEFFDALIELIATRNLMINGSGREFEFSCYVTSNKRYESATEDDIATLKTWLESKDGVEDVKVSGLSDAYYGD